MNTAMPSEEQNVGMPSWWADTIVITNRALVKGDYLQQMENIASCHPRAFILREKDLSKEEYEKLAKAVWEICKKEGVPCYLHTDVELAEKIACPYVHMSVGKFEEMTQEKSESAEISATEQNVKRKANHVVENISEQVAIQNGLHEGTVNKKNSLANLTGRSVSCHSLEDVQKAINYGATQIVLGTIFETDCKKGLKGKGLSFVKEITDYCKQNGDIPVFAIGGISPDNIASVKAAGAKGGCMMSYVMRYPF